MKILNQARLTTKECTNREKCTFTKTEKKRKEISKKLCLTGSALKPIYPIIIVNQFLVESMNQIYNLTRTLTFLP